MSSALKKKPPTVVLVGGGSMVSGREIMMLELARGLRHAGINVEFIASIWGGRGEFVSRLKADGFKFYRVRLGFISISLSWKPFIWTLDQLRYWPSLVIGYLKAIKNAAPGGVVHTNWHHALLLMPFLNRHRDIYWSHDIVPNKWHYGHVFRAIANRVAFMVCVSHAAARSLTALGISPAKIVVIHNSVLVDPVITMPGLQKPLRLGVIGQIAAWKGHDDILAALARMPDGATNVIVKIFGSGDPQYVDALKSKAAALGVAERIEWLGFVANQRDIFSQIDVCVMPSRFEEPFGLSALEAGISGRPVICTGVGGLPEIVKDGETGILIEAGRPDQLAAALETLVKQPELIATMGKAARKRTQMEFSYAHFVRQFIHVIEGLE